jgi:hypothetical protein
MNGKYLDGHAKCSSVFGLMIGTEELFDFRVSLHDVLPPAFKTMDMIIW